jgi:predicted CXXCH cytochrome family protein
MISGLAALLVLVPQVQRAERDDQCIKCHEDQGAEVKETMHQKAGVGCVSCHGTDEIVNEKHKRTAAFRPAKLPQIAELCGSCHRAVSEFYWMSPHADAASKDDGNPKHRSSCSACHEYHTTPRASPSRILRRCLDCHGKDSSEIREGRDFFWRLSETSSSGIDLRILMDRLERAPGVRIADMEAAFERVRSDLRALEIAQHGLDWKKLNADAGASADRASAAYNTLAERERRFRDRYFGLGVFLGLLALCAVLIARRARQLQGEFGA